MIFVELSLKQYKNLFFILIFCYMNFNYGFCKIKNFRKKNKIRRFIKISISDSEDNSTNPDLN